MKLNKLLGDCGHQLVFCNVATATKGIFKVAGLDVVFEFAKSLLKFYKKETGNEFLYENVSCPYGEEVSPEDRAKDASGSAVVMIKKMIPISHLFV